MKLISKSFPKEVVATKTYPYIGVGRNTQSKVLFTAPAVGTVIDDADTVYDLGYYSKDWAEDQFDIFIGAVTITSEK